jgi:hypothetical protein
LRSPRKAAGAPEVGQRNRVLKAMLSKVETIEITRNETGEKGGLAPEIKTTAAIGTPTKGLMMIVVIRGMIDIGIRTVIIESPAGRGSGGQGQNRLMRKLKDMAQARKIGPGPGGTLEIGSIYQKEIGVILEIGTGAMAAGAGGRILAKLGLSKE